MQVNMRRRPTATQLTPVVLHPHERPRPFPPPGHISAEPDHGGCDPQVTICRIHLDDVPSSQKERRILGIIVRTDQSDAHPPDIGVGAYLEVRSRAASRETGVEASPCVDAVVQNAVERGNELLDRPLELSADHCSFRKWR